MGAGNGLGRPTIWDERKVRSIIKASIEVAVLTGAIDTTPLEIAIGGCGPTGLSACTAIWCVRRVIGVGFLLLSRCTHLAQAAFQAFEKFELSLYSIIGTDRSLASEGRGRRFESSRARQ
jgi:hypothetical protein